MLLYTDLLLRSHRCRFASFVIFPTPTSAVLLALLVFCAWSFCHGSSYTDMMVVVLRSLKLNYFWSKLPLRSFLVI